MAHHYEISATQDRLELGGGFRVAHTAALFLGGAGLIVAVLVGYFTGFRRFNFAYLINFSFFLSLSVGAVFFVLLQHLTKSGWSVSVRRIAETMACAMPVLLALSAPIVISVIEQKGSLYAWNLKMPPGEPIPLRAPEPEIGESAWTPQATLHSPEAHEMSATKRVYLNAPFFIVRLLIYFAIWSSIAISYWRRSVLQDETGDTNLTVRSQSLSPILMIVFALTTTLAAFDLLMSLDPTWYSTIFGVYFFAGSVVAFFATMIILVRLLQANDVLRESVSMEHFHDLGKFLFAFVFFWGYIAFSQFMLIWYAALPEEVGWFSRRGATTVSEHVNGFSWIGLTLLFGHLFIPFAGLLSRHVKRNRAGLIFWAVWMLVMHWIDLYWIVMPEFDGGVHFGVLEVACFVGVGGIWIATLLRIALRHSIRPTADPRLDEALAFQNL